MTTETQATYDRDDAKWLAARLHTALPDNGELILWSLPLLNALADRVEMLESDVESLRDRLDALEALDRG